MEARYYGFHIGIKAVAFIPSLAAFIAFITLIIIYGRMKPTKSDPYTGRLQKVPKAKKPPPGIFSIVKARFLARRARGDDNVAGDAIDGGYKQRKPSVTGSETVV